MPSCKQKIIFKQQLEQNKFWLCIFDEPPVLVVEGMLAHVNTFFSSPNHHKFLFSLIRIKKNKNLHVNKYNFVMSTQPFLEVF